jgi:hypothetical protein
VKTNSAISSKSRFPSVVTMINPFPPCDFPTSFQ